MCFTNLVFYLYGPAYGVVSVASLISAYTYKENCCVNVSAFLIRTDAFTIYARAIFSQSIALSLFSSKS